MSRGQEDPATPLDKRFGGSTGPRAWFPLSGQPRHTPTVVINPLDDHAFAAFVRSVLPEAGMSPEWLQRALSQRYPHAVVHRRELSSEPIEVWYVYRDGRWTPRRD